MRRRLAAAAVAFALALGGCAGAGSTEPLGGKTWQVVALHTAPEVPGELPADAAGKVTLWLDGADLAATTGCAPLRATVDAEPGRITLGEVDVGAAGDCIGGSRYVHDALTRMLAPGAQLDVRELNEGEATLTEAGDALDRPSIRVMAL